MTQAELAERAGVALKSVGNYEMGITAPQAATIAKLREALELPESLDGAFLEVQERERRAYMAAGDEANRRINARQAQLSLRAFSDGQLLRELLHRAEDPDYARELDEEAEREHYYELQNALEEPAAVVVQGSFQQGTRIVVSDPDDELPAVADESDIEGAGENSI